MIFKSQVSNINSRKGFTLIELLITIFLVSVGLIGVIAFFNASLQSQFDAKNEVIAAGLAQEGTELVRNIVEYNFLQKDSNIKWWKNLVTDNLGTDSNCTTMDYTSLLSHDCLVGNRKQVCIDSDYRYLQGNPNCSGNRSTDFLRTIDIEVDPTVGGTNLDLGKCLKVTVMVGWPNTISACNTDITTCPYKTTSTDVICKPRQ